VGVVPVLAAALAYGAVTRGYFFADDFAALYALANGTGERFIVEPTGGHLLLVRNLAYALTWALAGADPRPFMWSAFLTHLGLVALLFALVRRATGHALVAAVTATLWGTCPLAAGTLEWYAVYGQALATVALAVVLAWVVRRQVAARPVGAGTATAWAAILLAGSTCFGTGVAVALLAPAVVGLALPRARLTPRAWVVLLGLPPAVALLYAANHLTSGSDLQSVGPKEHLVALATDLPLILRFTANLLASGASSLVLGPFWERSRYPDAGTLLAAGAVGAALVAGVAGGTPRTRRLVLALLVVAAGAYGIVAVGRAGLYELFGGRNGQDAVSYGATTARYHYMAQFVLAAALGIAVGGLLERFPPPRRLGIAAGSAALALLLAGAWRWPPAVNQHTDVRRGAAVLMRRIRAEVRRASGPVALLRNQPWGAGGPLLGVRPERFPGRAAAFVVYFRDDVVDGREVRFVGTEAERLEARHVGGRIATLLVPAPSDANGPEALRPRPARPGHDLAAAYSAASEKVFRTVPVPSR